jgi:hypothetical protein
MAGDGRIGAARSAGSVLATTSYSATTYRRLEAKILLMMPAPMGKSETLESKNEIPGTGVAPEKAVDIV